MDFLLLPHSRLHLISQLALDGEGVDEVELEVDLVLEECPVLEEDEVEPPTCETLPCQVETCKSSSRGAASPCPEVSEGESEDSCNSTSMQSRLI